MSRSENAFPSRANVKLYQGLVAQANSSLRVLKRKRDALEMRLRDLELQIKEINDTVPGLMKDALMELAWARMYGSDLSSFLEAPSKGATSYTVITNNKLMGVVVRKMHLVVEPNQTAGLLSLSRDATHMKNVKQNFGEILEHLVAIGSLRLSIDPIQQALRDTNMRVNSLEYVHIPKLERILKYIQSELEERDREDFYRMKRMQRNKMKKIEEKKGTAGKALDSEENIEPKTDEFLDYKHFVDPLLLGPQFRPNCFCNRRRVKKRHNIDPADKGMQTDF